MPTRPFRAADLDDAQFCIAAARVLQSADDEDADDMAGLLLFAAAEPLMRSIRQEIGNEHLSVESIRRDAAAQGFGGDVFSANIYDRFGFHLDELETVVEKLQVPLVVRIKRDRFTGEECVLLLLRRLRTPGTLLSLTKETGRSISQISLASNWAVRFIRRRWAHLVDERSFTDWAPHFRAFADAFSRAGLPLKNLIGFIDGKLWKIARPGKFQKIMYSGHKRIHGIKTQGIIFPNGLQPYPFGPVNGSRHDGFLLRESGILELMAEVCNDLGEDFILFGDSAYPRDKYLWAMYKEVGGVMPAWQAVFNADMSPERVAVEWGFGKVVSLWPFLDVRNNMKVLRMNVQTWIEAAFVLTNMHTCLYGSAVSRKYGLGRPNLDAYMSGNGQHN